MRSPLTPAVALFFILFALAVVPWMLIAGPVTVLLLELAADRFQRGVRRLTAESARAEAAARHELAHLKARGDKERNLPSI